MGAEFFCSYLKRFRDNSNPAILAVTTDRQYMKTNDENPRQSNRVAP